MSPPGAASGAPERHHDADAPDVLAERRRRIRRFDDCLDALERAQALADPPLTASAVRALAGIPGVREGMLASEAEEIADGLPSAARARAKRGLDAQLRDLSPAVGIKLAEALRAHIPRITATTSVVDAIDMVFSEQDKYMLADPVTAETAGGRRPRVDQWAALHGFANSDGTDLLSEVIRPKLLRKRCSAGDRRSGPSRACPDHANATSDGLTA